MNITVMPSASGKKLVAFESGTLRLYSVDTSAGLLKVTIEREQLNIWTRDSKLRCFNLLTGELLYETAHNGQKLSKEDKKKRKKQYLSRLENEKNLKTSA